MTRSPAVLLALAVALFALALALPLLAHPPRTARAEASTPKLTFTKQVPHGPFAPRAIPAGDYGGAPGGDKAFYIMGGRNMVVHFERDIWRSADGVHWDLVKKEAEFGARGYMDAVFLRNGSMVLMGGQSLTRCFSDVWISHDRAKSWSKVLDNAPWGLAPDGSGKQVGRSAYKTLVLEDDTILIFSGDYGSFFDRKFFADVWESKDAGLTWSKRFQAKPGKPSWRPRAGMQVVRMPGTKRLLFMGGDNDNYSTFTFQRFNDIWRSEDLGASWEFVRIAPWGNRTGHQCWIWPDDGCVWCAGGQGTQGACPDDPSVKPGSNLLYHDVWRSCDNGKGQQWERVTNAAFGCPDVEKCGDPAANCGVDDMVTRIVDGRVWFIAGDQEKNAPFPMSNTVWSLEIEAQSAGTYLLRGSPAAGSGQEAAVEQQL